MTTNLGLVKAIHSGVTAPTNLQMLWYDDNFGQKIHKYYDTNLAAWRPVPGNSSLVFASGAINFPLVGVTGVVYVDTLNAMNYIWDTVNLIYVQLDYWRETSPGNIRRDGNVGINADPILDPQGNPISFYNFGKAGMVDNANVDDQHGFYFGQEVFPGVKPLVLGYNLISVDPLGNNAAIAIIPPGSFGNARPIMNLTIGGGGLTPIASSSTSIDMSPETIDTPGGNDTMTFTVVDSAGNNVGYLNLDDFGEVEVMRSLQVGDVNVGSTLVNGMIRWDGSNFQGYNGSWVNLDNAAVPTTVPYQILQADGFGVLQAQNEINDNFGVPFIVPGSYEINDAAGITAYESAFRILYGALNTGIGDDPRVSFGPSYGNALIRTKNLGVIGDTAIDWQNSVMNDFAGVQSIDWDGRYLKDLATGATVADWSDGLRSYGKWAFNSQATSLTQTGYTEASPNADVRAMDGTVAYSANDLRDIIMTLLRDLKTKGILSV